MNTDQIMGNWRQFRGEAQRRWGKLTNDQLDQVEGNREKLLGQIQESYGIARDAAETQVKEWEEACARNSSQTAA